MISHRRLAVKILICLVLYFCCAQFDPAVAQERREHGFRVNGYLYPDVNIPMTYYEKKIFDKLAVVVDGVAQDERREERHMPAGVSHGTLKSVKLNPEKTYLLVNLDKRLMFREGPDGMEDFLHLLSMNAYVAAKDIVGKDVDVKYVYDGEVFGYGRPPPGFQYNALPSDSTMQAAAPTGGATKGARDKVVVAASHGLYRKLDPSGTFDTWAFQRPDRFYGIIEDELTPYYADELASLFNSQRYDILTELARNNTEVQYIPPKGTGYTDPNRTWRLMGARYHLQSILPKKPTIWQSSGADQEYGQDRRARPYYANSIRADGLIHLHSNASNGQIVDGVEVPGTATGGDVIYSNLKSPNNSVLAEQIACSMQEIVRKTTVYKTYSIKTKDGTNGYGEIDLANMPSVLVELAYHDNPSDAAMLLDPTFRSAAVKGIAKGWRLFREGKQCGPLALNSVSDITGPANTDLYGTATYSGNGPFGMISKLIACPIYPLNYYCPAGWGHTLSNITNSSFEFLYRCEHSVGVPQVTSYWRAHIVDEDGVKSNEIDWRFTCGGAGSAAAR